MNGVDLKCFSHPDRDAVAICSVCGQGLCEGCSVRIAGKFYCKPDADRTFGKEIGRTEKYVRPASITVAAILFFIFGALWVIAGLIVSALAGVAASFTSVPFIGPLAGVTAAGILFIGLIILVFGVLYLVAGNWLGNRANHNQHSCLLAVFIHFWTLIWFEYSL